MNWLEPLPGRVVLLGELVDDTSKQVDGERLAEHCELAEQIAVVVGEAIDAGGNYLFYRVRKGVDSLTTPGARQSVPAKRAGFPLSARPAL